MDTSHSATDGAAQARQERFGHLPQRIRFEDMVVEKPAVPADAAAAAYDPAGAWSHYSCLAVDLGL
ncbi:hypothetical protein FNH09_23360 [Streptomyces adustus]|uniref:Uncharacterized protein n=1 Tax=Streptomyces adustus TaxID=1609272 RepID=A0A5N8VFQ7_9ACTN|nr:hypothetical protein [Streptomyces adustus]MPY34077.1 hypothetical protein [Streptomyces adustus]